MIGIYSAGLKTRDTSSPVIVAGIQSVASKPYALGAFDVVLIDEAHLVPLSDDTSYRKVIKALRTQNPHVRFIGLTATPYRLNTGLLHRGKNPLFTEIAYDVPVRDLIEQGYLCPLISKATIRRLDTTGVATRGGEYVAGALERAVDQEDVTNAIVDEMCRLFAGRNKWLVFCAGVQHAEHVAVALVLAGIAAAPVHGTLDPETRAARLRDFKEGKLRALTSMDVLTTGYDEPAIDAIALLRPTKSAGLYCLDEETQILTAKGWKGRGEIQVGDLVAAPDPDTLETRWVPVRHTIDRNPLPDEQVVTYASPHLNFAVSDRHRMLWRARPRSDATARWRISTADVVARRRSEFELPVASVHDVPAAPLSDDEIRFIGWVMTDGSINRANKAISIYQSARYPAHLAEIRRVLVSCGFKYREYTRPATTTFGHGFQTLHRFVISRGAPRGRDKHLRGWGALELWLSKAFAPALTRLSVRQFAILLEAMHLGDGAKQSGQRWTRRSFHISTGSRDFADRVQALAVVRGWACNVATHSYNKAPLYVLHLKRQTSRAIGGASAKDRETLQMHAPTGRLWCVENEVGTLITRRRGKVLVTGNCQMVGRGFRLHPSKQNTLVLDFAGNVEYFGPVDTIEVKEKTPGDGKAPTKKCPNCLEILFAGVRICNVCQFEFPEPEKPPIVPEATTRPILSTEPEPIEDVEVDDVGYSRHEKPGKIPSLRVDYLRGYRVIASEWICFEHTGFARTKAEQWWKRRSSEPPPATVDEALLHVDDLPTPSAIKTQRDGRFTRVVAATLPPKPEPPAFPRACWSCAFYSSAKNCCEKWDATPPADVLPVGCEAWTEEEVPF
jgi:hypothetical protein